ncbi:MAG: hypothetical protein ACPLW4_00935, partial [Nitrososphaeria archaeon]
MNKVSIIVNIGLLLWALFTLAPLLPLLFCAFTGKMYLIDVNFNDFSLDFFMKVISMMGSSYFNSLMTALGAVLLNVPLCFLAAYAFAKFR